MAATIVSNSISSGIAGFVGGTRIATRSGEVAVEALRIGDLVGTPAGDAAPVRWIGRRRHAAETVAGDIHLRPVRIRADALARGVPTRDLLVSPSHALLVDGALIPAGALVNGVSILRDPAAAVAYVQVELERPEILLAEGAPAESFVAIAGALPRIEQGAAVDAARRRLAVRAGLTGAIRPPGRLCGHVERIVASDDGVSRTIEGWVLDEADPNEPVELDVIVEAGPRLRLPASRYRPDLDRAGLGGGRCGFSVRLPGQGRVQVRRAADGAVVPIAA